MFFELLRALLYGIIEGITEWLPVSSTGHLIIINAIPALELGSSLPGEFRAEFCEMFEVVIQLGAIMAVVVFFFDRLYPFGRKSHPKTADRRRIAARSGSGACRRPAARALHRLRSARAALYSARRRLGAHNIRNILYRRRTPAPRQSASR